MDAAARVGSAMLTSPVAPSQERFSRVWAAVSTGRGGKVSERETALLRSSLSGIALTPTKSVIRRFRYVIRRHITSICSAHNGMSSPDLAILYQCPKAADFLA